MAYANRYDYPISYERKGLISNVFLFFKSLGLSFQQSRVFLYLFYISMPVYWICKNTKNINVAFAMTMILPGITMGIQLRNSIAITFIYLGLLILYNKSLNTVVKIALYCLCVYVGVQFHQSMFFYLLFILLLLDMKEKTIAKLSFASLTICTVFYSTLKSRLLSLFNFDLHVTEWLSLEVSWSLSSLFWAVFRITLLMIIIWLTRMNIFEWFRYKGFAEENDDGHGARYMNFTLKITRILPIMLPPILLSGSFFRLVQFIMPILIIAYSKNTDRFDSLITLKTSVYRFAYPLVIMLVFVYYSWWQGDIFNYLNSLSIG